MKKNKTTFILGVAIIIFLVIYMITFQISVIQKGVLTTFGKPVASLEKPGLYFKWPYPIQDVVKFDSRIQILTDKFEEIYTRDGKNIILQTSIGWRIVDPLQFYISIGNKQRMENNLEGILRTYQNGVIGEHPLSSLISTRQEDLKFDKIEEIIRDRIEKDVAKKYGIEVLFVKIKRIMFPEEVTKMVFKRMQQERESIIKRIESEGEGEARKIRAEADSFREKILAEARAEAKKIKAEGDAKAAEYYKIFEENRDLAIFLKKLSTLEEILDSKSTVILDSRTPPFDILEKGLNIRRGKKDE